MRVRWLTAGESHGPALSAIIEGIPASVEISSKDIDFHLYVVKDGIIVEKHER